MRLCDEGNRKYYWNHNYVTFKTFFINKCQKEAESHINMIETIESRICEFFRPQEESLKRSQKEEKKDNI